MTSTNELFEEIERLSPQAIEGLACLVKIVRDGKSASGKWLAYKGELKLKKEVDINNHDTGA